jgi:hypothetical protein
MVKELSVSHNKRKLMPAPLKKNRNSGYRNIFGQLAAPHTQNFELQNP